MSLFDESALRELLRDELRTVIRQELGNKPATAGDYLSVAEAARIAAVQGQTIRAWIRGGKLREYKAGRVLRVRKLELEAFLANGSARSTPADLSPEQLSPPSASENFKNSDSMASRSRDALPCAASLRLDPRMAPPTTQRLSDRQAQNAIDNWSTFRQISMNVLDEPLTPPEARRIILQALASGDVRFTSHALDEMAKDDITQAEALGILRAGVIEPGEFVGST